jgi:hypothetical protein
LDLVKKTLNSREPVVCVNSQLIAAGVDFDFALLFATLQAWIQTPKLQGGVTEMAGKNIMLEG